ncbi:hypothetical protein [Crocosphaera sp.]|nr:hypothetical protein [Crocosphaera sp.]
MAKASEKPLQPNPFRTYRDPKTGLWVVIAVPETVTYGQKITSNDSR